MYNFILRKFSKRKVRWKSYNLLPLNSATLLYFQYQGGVGREGFEGRMAGKAGS